VREDEAELNRVPWEDRSLPWRRRFLRTVGDAMVRPSRLGAAIACSQGGGSARFLLALTLVAAVPTALAAFAFGAFLEGSMPPASRWSAASARNDLLAIALACAAGVAVAVAAVLAGVLAVAGLATLVLRMSGVDAPWRRTWPTFAYTAAPLVVCAVPCLGPYCGVYVAGVWWLVAAGIALGTSCRASAGRAIAAVVIPAVAIIGLVTGGMVLFVVLPATAAVRTATAPGAAAATAPNQGAPAADGEPEPGTAPVPETEPEPAPEDSP
jgi:hypothetical protein